MVEAEKLKRMIATVSEKCDALEEDRYRALDLNMAIDFEEHFRFQQLQAEAHASGLISWECALIIYDALGEVGSESNGGWSKGTDLPTKVVVTQFMGEMLSRKVKARV